MKELTQYISSEDLANVRIDPGTSKLMTVILFYLN